MPVLPRPPGRPSAARRSTAALCAGLLLGAAACGPRAAPKTPEALNNADAYARLQPAQQALVGQLHREAAAAPAGSPAAFYGAWPLHRQTTFEAVTHALLRTTLRDADGRDLGTGLSLVQRIDRVAGQEAGVRGDQQFRLYVDLRPDALDRIRASREFARDKDNTVFHKGYPVNFRLTGRFPSIQISITPEGDRADIDVDYLSSGIPQGLFNGHLSSANSDVRARGNDDRHNRRWNDLRPWWTAVVAFLSQIQAPAAPVAGPALAPADEPELPSFPRDAVIDSPAVATTEFLTDWLVRRNLDEALSVLSPRASTCVNDDEDVENERLRQDDTRDLLGRVMREVVAGRRARHLSDVIMPVQAWDDDLRVVAHPFDRAFTLALIDDAEARGFLCDGAAVAGVEPPAWAETLFQLRPRQGRSGAILVLLWARERGRWLVRSVDVADP